MTDDLRDDFENEPPLFEDEDQAPFDDFSDLSADFDDLDDFDDDPSESGRTAPFIGLTPFQRFFLAAWLLVLSCLLSSMCLIFTNRIVWPF